MRPAVELEEALDRLEAREPALVEVPLVVPMEVNPVAEVRHLAAVPVLAEAPPARAAVAASMKTRSVAAGIPLEEPEPEIIAAHVLPLRPLLPECLIG